MFLASLCLRSVALAHVPLDIGDMTLTEIDARPAADGGQWFELRNNDGTDGNNPVDNFFRDHAGLYFEVTENVPVYEGEAIVFASQDSPVEADFRWTGAFSLAAGEGSLTLVDYDRGDRDTVAWDASWPDPGIATIAVNVGVASNAWANDLPQNWCFASPTPGAENGWCPGSDTDDDGDGYSERDGDCDDADATIFPGAPDHAPNGRDDDCNGQVDDGDAPVDTGNSDSGHDDSGHPDDPGEDSANPDSGQGDSGSTDPGSGEPNGGGKEGGAGGACGCATPPAGPSTLGVAGVSLIAANSRRRGGLPPGRQEAVGHCATVSARVRRWHAVRRA
jgi:hypothetical protein